MSKLQYGLVFSTNALQQYRQKLQLVQNRALRICCLANWYVSNYSLHQQHHVLPIRLRSKLDLITLMFKTSRRMVSENPTWSTQRSTRLNAAPTLPMVKPNTSVFLCSMSYVGPNEWNGLPVHITQMTALDSFKKVIRQRIDSEFALMTSIY